jgi:pyruvate ferredoxin oxidoreductase gamma subunit
MAALRRGLYVQSFPEYGPERGGAPVKAYNRINDSKITLHCGIDHPDMVAVLDKTLMEAEDITQGLKDEGALVVNTPQSPEEIRKATDYPGRIITVDADGIAEETNRFSNVPLLGALTKAIETVPIEDVEEALREYLSAKLSEEKLRLNLEALLRGYKEVLEGAGGKRHSRARPRPRPSPTYELKGWRELPMGGVLPYEGRKESRTGGWRQHEKPIVDESLCVNCLLCWVNCPEPAIIVEGRKMEGYDYSYCKGCGICQEVCPSEAISMVPEAQTVPPRGKITDKGTVAEEKEGVRSQ